MTDTTDDAFDPTDMESMLVARPLLELMQSAEARSDDPDLAAEEAPQGIPVVIDLNYSFSGGLSAAKANVIAFLQDPKQTGGDGSDTVLHRKTRLSPQYVFALLCPQTIRALAGRMIDSSDAENRSKPLKQREVFMIWPDFKLEGHVHRTVATIKADAARTSFGAEGKGIVWAVIDSGISGDHWHFKRHKNLDLSSFNNAIRHMDFTRDWPDIAGMDAQARNKAIEQETAAALTDDFGHGSHVAGIIAGEYITNAETGYAGTGRMPGDDLTFKNDAFVYYKRRDQHDKKGFSQARQSHLSGMAPLTKLVSFKVLDDRGRGEVSNIIAALAHIQEINEYGRFLRIQGVNLSVGYPFNPEWFACGKSPLCVEVDRLVKTGVVVVVSAGNSGYGSKQTLMTRKVRAGMLMTINDPGNARLAITVGATHSEKPHEYGPSYFSSKGPTGDGRLKPDLLAPGERIVSCGAGHGTENQGRAQDRDRLYIDQSGTSMAAPHVSGAIAAFLSVRREFIGNPEEVKDIFMKAATDLGRDRNMQGAGVLDLMRAIQSV